MTQPPEESVASAPTDVYQTDTFGRPEKWHVQKTSQAASERRTTRPFGWRIPVAIIILALLVAPGAIAILAANSRYANYVGTGLVLWALLAGLGLLVFLAVAYVVSYVVSAAWHDAQNARLRR